ncbi:MAG TPA: YceI family protein [Propionicimonas sp.]|nr:YceI family protein [Propionicimonas sp.]HQA78365.1 YceI family protein [Propionicimonas sp.]HQD97828.1 YceI family protein [Propionicimonas sp.]
MTSIRDLSGTYNLDPSHSRVGFVARHAMIAKVRGAFNEVAGTATIDGANPSASALDVTIQTASVDTRDANRDSHLASPDFFDAAQYPTITFKATDFAVTDDQTVEVTGDLTIKDITRPVVVPFTFEGVATDPFGNERAGFEGQVTINRKDWGLTWNAALETGGVLVGDKVTLELEVSAVKA